MLPKVLTNMTDPHRHRLWAELAGDSSLASLRAVTLGWVPAKRERLCERRRLHAVSVLRPGSRGTLRANADSLPREVRGPGLFFATPGTQDDYGPIRPRDRWNEYYWILEGSRLEEWRAAGWWDTGDRFWPLREKEEARWWALFGRWIEALACHDRAALDACKLELERRISCGPWTRVPAGEASSPILQAVALWRGAPGKHWSLPETARTLGLSYTRFRSRFRLELGESPHRYLERLRMEVASHWLRSTAEPIKSIAWRCGYPRVETFIRAFQRRHRRTPLDYRSGNAGRCG